MRTLRTAATCLAAIAQASGGLAIAMAGPAMACVPDDDGGCDTPTTYLPTGRTEALRRNGFRASTT